MRVGVGEAVVIVMVDKGAVAIILVCVKLACMVIATIVPTRFWSIIWVGEPVLPGRLQDERMVTSERDINRSLNVFIFAFMLRNEALIRLARYKPLNDGNWSLLLLIIYKTLPSHIHRQGSVYLVHLGEILKQPNPADMILLARFTCRFFSLLFQLKIGNA